ncbi:peripherin-2-like [Ruditapes philippinarum]|uniref:peripherin-2-like n=1 Tax=Ruditapes philippinarum TaxID=129788 RepID=UPI00295B41B6|nr:peripherin-2-like [Ruditapes philippinarum]
MALLALKFSEEKRRNLAIFIAISHWMCMLPASVCLLLGILIYIDISNKISFIEDHIGNVVPFFIAFSGFFGLFCHIFCGTVAFSNRTSVKQDKWKKLLLPALIATVLLFLLELITGIMCIVHFQGMKDSFITGIKRAMSSYKDRVTVKAEVDTMQISFECCGIRSYKDWFYVTWMQPEFVSSKKSHARIDSSDIIIDDVPFSCCTSHVLRPCINHHVHDNALHFNYDYHDSTTLYKHGCTNKLVGFYGNLILKRTGALMLFLSDIQFMVMICTRFLQTSIVSMTSQDRGKGASTGYLFTAPKEASDFDVKTICNKLSLDSSVNNTDEANISGSASTHSGVKRDRNTDKVYNFDQEFELDDPVDRVIKFKKSRADAKKQRLRLQRHRSNRKPTPKTENSISTTEYSATTDIAKNVFNDNFPSLDRKPTSKYNSSFPTLSDHNAKTSTPLKAYGSVRKIAEEIGPVMMRSFTRYSDIELVRLVHQKASGK